MKESEKGKNVEDRYFVSGSAIRLEFLGVSTAAELNEDTTVDNEKQKWIKNCREKVILIVRKSAKTKTTRICQK